MKHWIYPANPKYYDVVSAFTNEETPAWPVNSKVEIGDYVYIYCGVPFKQIMFKCEVVDIDVPAAIVMKQGEKYAKVKGNTPKKRFMFLKTLCKFEQDPESLVSFSRLKENGLKGSIMGPQCLENNKELFEYIRQVEK